MGLFGQWFKKSPPEDYEQVLARLSKDIHERQTRLSEIRLRERRATLFVSIYALVAWIAYTTLWYMEFLPSFTGRSRSNSLEKTAKGVPVFVGPIVILLMRRIMQLWYNRISDAEEKALVDLRKQQREKVEEVKQKTNYYNMRNLIERYDDGPSPESPAGLRRRVPPQGQPPQPPVAPQTPQRNLQITPQTPAQKNLTPELQQQLSPSPQRPMPPPRKQWFDKLADAILGDDDSSTTGAASRYALICQKCFAHNGLVKESMWEDAQYQCPKCGYFNPSARTLRQIKEGKKSRSPDGRATQPQSAAAGNFAPPIIVPTSADSAPSPNRSGDGTSMDVDS